ncbi:MAG: hypothetical protein ACREFX_06425 [Opitutaceae bacterium]
MPVLLPSLHHLLASGIELRLLVRREYAPNLFHCALGERHHLLPSVVLGKTIVLTDGFPLFAGALLNLVNLVMLGAREPAHVRKNPIKHHCRSTVMPMAWRRRIGVLAPRQRCRRHEGESEHREQRGREHPFIGGLLEDSHGFWGNGTTDAETWLLPDTDAVPAEELPKIWRIVRSNRPIDRH